MTVLAAIPSPGTSAFELGPLTVRAYGVLIALGVVVAVVVTQRRWQARGGHPDDISAIATWAVPAGVVGARLYHVITDLEDYVEDPWSALAVWEGGLGIWGAISGGVLGGWYAAQRRGLPVAGLLDAAAPALLLAQAIGRLGNWFNRELFGRPTDLPWGLEIPPADRPARYLDAELFHPTFLYEALWNLALFVALVLIDRRWRSPATGSLFALYVVGYCAGRIWIESLRIDPSPLVLGARLNVWTSAAVGLAALGWLVWANRRNAGPRSARLIADEAGASR